MSKTEHTPTPWSLSASHLQIMANPKTTWFNISKMSYRLSMDKDPTCPMTKQIAQANAEFTCLAANCHDDLLDACKNALGAYEALRLAGVDKELPGYDSCLAFLKTTLTKAKKRA